VSEFPEKKTRPDTTHIEAAIAIIIRDGKILVQRRPETGLMAGLWEFPGGKLKAETQRTQKHAEKNYDSGEVAAPRKAAKSASRRATENTEKSINQVSRAAPLKATWSNAETHSHREKSFFEIPEEAVVREVREETGLRIQVCEKLGTFNHAYTRFRVKLHVFICKRKAGTVHNRTARWVTLEELEGLAMPSVNRRIVRALEKQLNSDRAD
jgi:8-oxo-dGTP pyrophosphatase MutT (NUDIX family)